MSSAKVTDKKTTQLLWLLIKFPPKFLAFPREKPIHSYLSQVKCAILNRSKEYFKKFNEFPKKYKVYIYIVLLPCLSGHLVCQSSTIHSHPTIKRPRSFLLSKQRCPSVVGWNEWLRIDNLIAQRDMVVARSERQEIEFYLSTSIQRNPSRPAHHPLLTN